MKIRTEVHVMPHNFDPSTGEDEAGGMPQV